MNQSELIIKVASILSALLGSAGAPESTFYLAFGCDIDKWNDVRSILLGAGWIKISGNFVTLTPTGIEVAKAVDKKVSTVGPLKVTS